MINSAHWAIFHLFCTNVLYIISMFGWEVFPAKAPGPRQFKPWPCFHVSTSFCFAYRIKKHRIWYFLKQKKNCWYHKKTANCQPSHLFKGFHSKRTPCSIRWMVKLYTPLETQYPENYSPHSKRFCYRIFSCGWAKKWNESQTKKEGSGKETLADKRWDFENRAHQQTECLIGLTSRTLLTSVDQRFDSYWEVMTHILIFCSHCF